MESSVMITVWSGSLPPHLEPLPVPELAHLDVFTSRSSEEGRERYRLHVGYFADPTAAERVLPRVREIYPSAWVVPASRHRPLVRLKPLAMQTWPADPDSPVTANSPLPRAALLEPALLEIPELDAASAQASVLTAEPKSAPAKPVNEIDSLTAPPAAQMLSAAGAVGIMAPPLAASPELLRPFSRLSVEDWCAEAPVAAEAAVARSWLTRLPKLTRLARERLARTA